MPRAGALGSLPRVCAGRASGGRRAASVPPPGPGCQLPGVCPSRWGWVGVSLPLGLPCCCRVCVEWESRGATLPTGRSGKTPQEHELCPAHPWHVPTAGLLPLPSHLRPHRRCRPQHATRTWSKWAATSWGSSGTSLPGTQGPGERPFRSPAGTASWCWAVPPVLTPTVWPACRDNPEQGHLRSGPAALPPPRCVEGRGSSGKCSDLGWGDLGWGACVCVFPGGGWVSPSPALLPFPG